MPKGRGSARCWTTEPKRGFIPRMTWTSVIRSSHAASTLFVNPKRHVRKTSIITTLPGGSSAPSLDE